MNPSPFSKQRRVTLERLNVRGEANPTAVANWNRRGIAGGKLGGSGQAGRSDGVAEPIAKQVGIARRPKRGTPSLSRSAARLSVRVTLLSGRSWSRLSIGALDIAVAIRHFQDVMIAGQHTVKDCVADGNDLQLVRLNSPLASAIACINLRRLIIGQLHLGGTTNAAQSRGSGSRESH